jgi:hypothetical protein
MNGIYGRAATGLQDSSWAVNDSVAKIGARGEQKTETLLNGFGKKAAVLPTCGSRFPVSRPTSTMPSSRASRCC